MPITITFQEKDFDDLIDSLYTTQQQYIECNTEEEEKYYERVTKLHNRVMNAKERSINKNKKKKVTKKFTPTEELPPPPHELLN